MNDKGERFECECGGLSAFRSMWCIVLSSQLIITLFDNMHSIQPYFISYHIILDITHHTKISLLTSNDVFINQTNVHFHRTTTIKELPPHSSSL